MKRIIGIILDKIEKILKYKLPAIVFFLCPVKNNKIAFINFNGKGFGCNPKYIALEIIEEKLPYDLVWLVSDLNEPVPKEIRKSIFRSLKGIYEVATARVIITNVKNDLFLVKKSKQYIIQTWHGSFSAKLLEKEAIDKLLPQYIKESKKNSKQTDLFLSNSEALSKCYREAFWCECEILECGFPRNDILFNSNKKQKSEIRSKIGVCGNNRIALYAPTFRDDGSTKAYLTNYQRILKALETKGGEWTLVVRFHPNVSKQSLELGYQNNVLDATMYPDMQELLLISDILITDYSSTIFEFAAMGKPSFIYAADINEYNEMRGLRKDYFNMPYKVCTSEGELVKQLQEYTDTGGKLLADQFMAQFGVIDTGNASKKVVEQIRNII